MLPFVAMLLLSLDNYFQVDLQYKLGTVGSEHAIECATTFMKFLSLCGRACAGSSGPSSIIVVTGGRFAIGE